MTKAVAVKKGKIDPLAQLRLQRENRALELEVVSRGSPQTAADHVARAWDAWQKTTEGIFATAAEVAAAREAAKLNHGVWQTFFAEPGQRQRGLHFPFGERTAQMLTKIAASERLSNPNHGSGLPPSWRTLHDLAALDDEKWAIVEPHISPDMERADIRALVTHNHRAQGTGENEWYTPSKYVEAARDVMGEIDLDPATSATAQEVIRASRYYTTDDDGLEQPWTGRVWLNPPYAQPLIQQFVEKLVSEKGAGNVAQAVLLTHNYTDTGWFHLAEKDASAICFTRGRIKFVNRDGEECAPTQGQAFFYYGPNGDVFASRFREFGFVR